jgi:hypothetical protein
MIEWFKMRLGGQLGENGEYWMESKESDLI